jgi:hypothetical protein
MTPTHLVWLTWSLLLLVVWGVVWKLLKSYEIRKEMIIVSAWTSLLGLTEPLFVPAYWNPPSLFNLAQTTGFDVESIIFAYAIGGIAYALYMTVFPVEHEPLVPRDERIDTRHKYHLPLLLMTPMIFILLLIGTHLNPIYDAVIAMVVGGLSTWYCRPDLKKKMVVSAVLFISLYYMYFQTLILIFPGYVQRVWNIGAISGILITGIPVEELMFAFAFGFYWSTVYEHFTWKKVPDQYIPTN